MSKFFLPVWALLLTACQAVVPGEACKPSPQEQAEWTQTNRANTAAAYRAYLARYPTGCYAAAASQRLKKPVPPVAVAGVTAAADRGDDQPDTY